MQLVINTYGSYLRKKDKCFIVKTDEKEFEVSSKKVENIMITTGAYLSTDAVKLAMDNNIDLLFLDEFGSPYGRVWHSKLGSTILIRRRQLEIAETRQGMDLVKRWIIRKIDNQMGFLKKLKSSRPKKKGKLEEYIDMLENIKTKIRGIEGSLFDKRDSLRGFEGSAGRIYFEALSFIVPDRFEFDGRSKQPAEDEFNCLLNYAYGILYSLVEKGCIIGGLDPYVGFMHTDNYNKKSLVFDLIELFRIWAEETVVYLFSARKVKKEYFDSIKGGLTLNKKGKAVLIENFNKNLEQSIRYRGRNIKKKDIIQFECHHIANNLLKPY